MVGTKIYKSYVENADGGLGNETFDAEQYLKCSAWCNENKNATIEEKEDYYEVVEIPAYVPTEMELQQQLKQAVQSHMDGKVQERDYDDLIAACSYASSTDHIFAAEGVACVKWRDAVWRKYFDVLADVDAGIRKFPTAEEMIEELPVLEW